MRCRPWPLPSRLSASMDACSAAASAAMSPPPTARVACPTAPSVGIPPSSSCRPSTQGGGGGPHECSGGGGGGNTIEAWGTTGRAGAGARPTRVHSWGWSRSCRSRCCHCYPPPLPPTRTCRGTAESMATMLPRTRCGPWATTRWMAASVSKVTKPKPRCSRLLFLSAPSVNQSTSASMNQSVHQWRMRQQREEAPIPAPTTCSQAKPSEAKLQPP